MKKKSSTKVLVVHDYDEAIQFYTEISRFVLIEDTVLSAEKWVILVYYWTYRSFP